MNKILSRKVLNGLSKLSYMLGVAFVIASLLVNAIPAAPAFAESSGPGGSDCAHENTDGDDIFCESLEGQSGSWTAPAGYTIIDFVIKAGTEDFGAVSGCYEVSQTFDSVSWNRVGDGRDCKEISHVEIYYQVAPPTSTPVTPTATNTPFNTPTATNTPENTPTNTPVPSETPSSTPETPTATPTNTPTEEAKLMLCHVDGKADDPANWQILTLPASAVYAAHINEDTGTPKAGHEQDFLINSPEDAARCAPAPTPTNTPTPTATAEPKLDVEVACSQENPNQLTWTVKNGNAFGVDFSWKTNKIGGEAGLGSVAANDKSSFNTEKFEGALEVWSANGLVSYGFAKTIKCNIPEIPSTPKTPKPSETPAPSETPVDETPEVEETPTTPVTNETPVVPSTQPAPKPSVQAPIPVTGAPAVLIPVTGFADSRPFTQQMFLNVGFGFIGLGLVLQGLSRRKEEDNI